MTHPEPRPDDDVNDDLDVEADDTDEDTGGHDRRERQDPTPGSGEAGEGWRQQTGYGERVPDPDQGDHAVEDHADAADAIEDHH
jgi:hypothetical protein